MKRRTLPANLMANGSNPLDCPISKLFRPASVGPAILFNVTEVGTGQQRVIAPFQIEGGYAPEATSNIKLVTAAVLSARFPYVTPPGWFHISREIGTERVYLVDGGYYENSGVATAQAVVRALGKLRAANPSQKFTIRLIVLVGPYEDNTIRDDYLTELLSPIRAFGQSRIARGQNYVNAARLAMPTCKQSLIKSGEDCQLIVGIKDLLYSLPLGWDMSELSRLAIESQDGQFDTCVLDDQIGIVNGACFTDFLKQDLD